jgi:hypothetical protein
MFFALVLPAMAEENITCPPERPHLRTVGTGIMTCTLLNCLGPLKCPKGGGDCSRGLASNCNTCKEEKQVLCLTDQELATAKSHSP